MSGIYAQVLNITVPVVPVAQPRQRHAMIGGHVRNYTPKGDPVNAYKAALQLAVGQAIKTPLLGPLTVAMRFYLPRPKYLLKKSSYAGQIPHQGKPDFDNLVKSTQDALNGIAWVDDSQIYCHAGSGKWFCEKEGQPRVVLIVACDTTLQTVKGG